MNKFSWMSVWLFILSLFLSSEIKGQNPYIQKIRIAVPSDEPVFTRAIQDKSSFIWLGSDKGLFRYDGMAFKQYFPAGDSADFHISALCEDPEGIIWIGCKDGNIYRLEKNEVSLFDPEEGTSQQVITDIVAAGDRTIWWSTAGEGIYVYNQGKVYNINKDDGLNDNYVYDLEIDREGQVWAGTDAGIATCRFENGKKFVKPLDPAISLPDVIVKVIKEDPQGNLWLGFQDGGAGWLDQGRKSFKPAQQVASVPFGPVQDISVTFQPSWIATASGELFEIDATMTSAGAKSVMPEDISFGKIFDLLGDSEGNLWILANSGLYRSTGGRLSFFNKADFGPLDNIHAIRNDINNPNRLWLSNDRGLFMLDLASGTTKRYLENIHMPDFKVMCIYQDKPGFIWAGTFNYGVFRISPADGSWMQITEDQGLVNNNVLAISRHDDTLWMATLGGASEVVLNEKSDSRPFTMTSQNLETGLVNNFIYCVFEDNYDQIWFGTDGDGINVKTKKGWIVYNEKNGLEDDVVYSITGDKYGNLWVATASKGIYKISEGKFINFNIEDGLSSLEISGIASVDDELVVVNDNGLDIINIPTGIIAQYDEQAGISGISPDLNSISKDNEGNVWIGTRTGIIRYRNLPGISTYGPRTVLEEMAVFLQPREMADGLVLGYGDSHVSFKYAGLWFSNPEKVLYQVFLEGYDLGWKDTYDRQAVYSNLPPGKYTFKVRSSLDKSFNNANEASFSFRIRGPFWLNFWFLFLMFILLAGLVFLLIKYRETGLRRKERELKEKIEFEFQILKNQVNPHFLFNSFSTLMSLIEDQPDQALQYTEKLSDFFRTILQFKDQQVINLDEELALIESYFFLLKKRFGDNLNLEIKLDEALKKTFIPPMTLQILIENAVKHNVISKDNPLLIKVYEDGGKIVVENNLQPKMTAEVSTGIGLENIRKRYRLITDQETEIEKMKNFFKVKLPVIK